MNRWLPHVRAALIGLHIFAIVLMAVPSPSGGLSRRAWKNPTVQGEFAAWTARFNAVGVDITQAELEERLWTLAHTYADAHGALLAPFMPYYRYCGTWQSWRMFIAPHRFPSRLHIEIEGPGGRWRTLYVARSDRFTWHRDQFDNDRMRAAIFRYGWRDYRGYYAQFGQWVAREAAADFPRAKRVQLRFWRYETASPEQVRTRNEPVGNFTSSLVYSLSEFR